MIFSDLYSTLFFPWFKVNIKAESWIKIIRWMILATIAFAFAVKLNVACRGVQKELHETRTRLCPKESCCDNYG